MDEKGARGSVDGSGAMPQAEGRPLDNTAIAMCLFKIVILSSSLLSFLPPAGNSKLKFYAFIIPQLVLHVLSIAQFSFRRSGKLPRCWIQTQKLHTL
jgi:hypothetical protein